MSRIESGGMRPVVTGLRWAQAIEAFASREGAFNYWGLEAADLAVLETPGHPDLSKVWTRVLDSARRVDPGDHVWRLEQTPAGSIVAVCDELMSPEQRNYYAPPDNPPHIAYWVTPGVLHFRIGRAGTTDHYISGGVPVTPENLHEKLTHLVRTFKANSLEEV